MGSEAVDELTAVHHVLTTTAAGAVLEGGASPLSGHRLTAEERTRGRATQRRLREERRAHAEARLGEHVDAAILALAEIVRDVDRPAERLRAAQEILSRLLGRPATVVAGEDEQPVRIVVESVFGRRGGNDRAPD